MRAGLVLSVAFAAAVSAGRADAGLFDEPVTFTRDVAPIIYRQCSACHQPAGVAPFSLLTYEEVRGRARQLLDAVTSRTMPPWKPEPGYGEFADARRLSDAEIAILKSWLTGGMRLGDPTDLPRRPPSADGWQLGKPDAIVKLADVYRLAATGDDRLRNFVVPTAITQPRYVRAWELKTSSPQAVHHATMLFDPTDGSRRLDAGDPDAGYEGLIPMSAANPEGFFLGWTPGQAASVAPMGTAWPIRPGSDLVLMLHLRPTGQVEEIDVSVGLYFSDVRPVTTPAMIRLNRQDIDIPPGESHYTITDTYTLPVGVDALAVQPHAHALATEVKGFATLPDGSRQWLVYIRKWDFHWQDAYRFSRPIALPAGTALTMEYVYDNSSGNPANRGRSPRRVTFGQRSSDEMGDLWIQVLPARAEDLPRLTQSLRRKIVPQHIAGFRMLLAHDPANSSLHDDLALLLWEAGDQEGALQEFSESLRLKPTAAAHYNVGNVLLPLGRFDEAARQFRDALTIDAMYAPGHLGLGLVHQAQGRPDAAIESFRRALELRPGWEEATSRLQAIDRLRR